MNTFIFTQRCDQLNNLSQNVSKTKYFYIKSAQSFCYFPEKEPNIYKKKKARQKLFVKLKRDEFQVFQVLTPRSLSIN